MKDKRLIAVTGIGLLMLAIACGMIASKQIIIVTGRHVLLQTRPIDPRDILKGDYVRLRYDINQPGNRLADGTALKTGKQYYVELVQSTGSCCVPGRIFAAKPAGVPSIRGRWNGGGMTYGIEQYFVAEGKGREIERLVGKGVAADAAVSGSGRAVLVRLLYDGNPVE
jgi:uncharacterized membrane-anchored protein